MILRHLLVSISSAIIPYTSNENVCIMKSTKVQVVFYGALVRVFAPPRGDNAEACIISSSQKGPCTPDSAILEQKRAGGTE